MTTTITDTHGSEEPDASAITTTIPNVSTVSEDLAPVTTTGPEASEESEDRPRALSRWSIDDVSSLFGSAMAALAFVWIIYEHVLAFSGIIGFAVGGWLTFMAFYAGVTALANPVTVVVDRLAGAVVASGATMIIGVVFWVVLYTFIHGWPALHHWNFYTHDMSGVRPTDPLTKGGIEHAIVGSGIQIGIATAISLPLGIGTAVYLTEVGGRLSRVVRTVVEAMTALPDILAGLFIYTLLIIGFHWQRTGLTAALALAVTMVPIIARSAEVVLRVVPGGLREAALALGASRWQSVWRVVLPTARSGLATSLILGVARIAGETAPLIIVSGASTFFNRDPLHNPMNSLPLFIFAGVRSGEPNYVIRAWGAAAVLLTLVLILFVTARYLARDKVKSR
jgi:phosphate transport system permease protein